MKYFFLWVFSENARKFDVEHIFYYAYLAKMHGSCESRRGKSTVDRSGYSTLHLGAQHLAPYLIFWFFLEFYN